MYVFETNCHGPDIDTQFFEAGEQVEEVVWSQGQLDGFDSLRGEAEIGER